MPFPMRLYSKKPRSDIPKKACVLYFRFDKNFFHALHRVVYFEGYVVRHPRYYYMLNIWDGRQRHQLPGEHYLAIPQRAEPVPGKTRLHRRVASLAILIMLSYRRLFEF